MSKFLNAEERSQRYRHSGEDGEYRTKNPIICENCAKACDGRLCAWVRYLTEEHIPEGAEYHKNPKTGNFRITSCPDFVAGRCGNGKPDDNSIKETAHAVIRPKRGRRFIAKHEKPARKADDDVKQQIYFNWVMTIQHVGAE